MNTATNADAKPLVKELEAIVGPVRVLGCPRYCDDGWRGCDACNTCGKTGSVIRVRGKIYPNSEEGWRDALAAVRADAASPSDPVRGEKP